MSRFNVGDKFRSRKDNQVYKIVSVEAGDWYRLDNIGYLVSGYWLSRDYEQVDKVCVEESENEKKAKELAKGRCIIISEMRQKECSYEGDYEWEKIKHPIHKQCEQVALEMAKWKDEQANLCFIMIAKLIKDGVLTKDCPEHIMVQQMIELYRNLKETNL